MTKNKFTFLFLLIQCFYSFGQKPNIVYIFADDLGYGDLSCYVAKDINTPNIDQIAKQGIKFTEFYSASSVCSPSRAALLTGRYPQRMGINTVFFPESFTGIPDTEITIPEILKEKGYATGIVGKWHLGHHYQYLPLQQGFDEYFGIPYSNDMESVVYMRGNEVESYKVKQQYITKTYTKEAQKFITKNKDNSFFLYIAHSMPHVPLYASEEFIGTSKRGLYGDVVQELDWSVGQILKSLREHGILENTLIVFSSDNGPWLAMKEDGGSAGDLREGKTFTFDGGMKVPTVAMWKNRIPQGIINNEVASQMDWFPTIANITGSSIPKGLVIDGLDISKVLTDKGNRKNSDLLFLDGKQLQGYRSGQWKVKLPYKGFRGNKWKQLVKAHDTLLFNLNTDPGEKNNLFEKYPEKAKEILKEMIEKYQDMGKLPPSLITKAQADQSHFKKQ
ncbi:sulfatase [uncultured Algibacter sp.]|uniref:sulfatase family protein n=1 Tax=uncultured Algibacter sp. TaxID=298659 RepID=UPI0025FD37A2|nr:sulfatase [uncultured Algibacter sp.]